MRLFTISNILVKPLFVSGPVMFPIALPSLSKALIRWHCTTTPKSFPDEPVLRHVTLRIARSTMMLYDLVKVRHSSTLSIFLSNKYHRAHSPGTSQLVDPKVQKFLSFGLVELRCIVDRNTNAVFGFLSGF